MTNPRAVDEAMALNDYFVAGVGPCPNITLAETVVALAARVRELEAERAHGFECGCRLNRTGEEVLFTCDLHAGYCTLAGVAALRERIEQLEADLAACVAPAEVGGGIINHVIERERKRAEKAEADLAALRERHQRAIAAIRVALYSPGMLVADHYQRLKPILDAEQGAERG